MEINIAPNVKLDAKKSITDTEAALAKKGNGKSHIGQVYAEEILELNIAPIVAIDPTDAWWGLRSSASGKRKGYPVAVFGGDHGDMKLEPDGGAELAEAIVNERFSAVICTETLSEAGEIRFISDFLSTLYRKNRKPLKLFCDEVDMYAPQIPRTPQESKALGAMQNIVRRGRGKGIGCMMISQRPAVVNKDVLSMVFTLFLLGMDHNLDLEQVERWTKRRGKAAILANPFIQEMLEQLPEAQPGDAWVLSPTKKLYERFRARAKRTFDSGKTPELDDEVIEPKVLAPIDIKRLGERIAAAVERQKAEDPKHLKAEVERLKRANSMLEVGAEALRDTLAQKPAPAPGKTKTVEREVVKPATLKRIESAIAAGDALIKRWDDRSSDAHEALMAVQAKADGHFKALGKQLVDLGGVLRGVEHAMRSPDRISFTGIDNGSTAPSQRLAWDGPNANTHRKLAMPKVLTVRQPGTSETVLHKTNGEPLKVVGAHQRILDALARLEHIGLSPSPKHQVALFAAASPTSSSYTNNLGALRTGGLIEYPTPGTIGLTDAGRARADAGSAPQTIDEVHSFVRGLVKPARWKILHALIGQGRPLAKADLAKMAGASETSSSFTNNLGSLRTLGLIDYPRPGQVAATDILFTGRVN